MNRVSPESGSATRAGWPIVIDENATYENASLVRFPLALFPSRPDQQRLRPPRHGRRTGRAKGDRSGPATVRCLVLFDGKDLSQWKGEHGDAKWIVRDGYAEVNGTGSIMTKEQFGDVQLHVEWAAPSKVEGDGQGRGNSGVYLQGRYEIQVLDSYQNKTYPDGQAGAFYGNFAPLVNASRKPGEWQTYDIIFQAPKPGPDGKRSNRVTSPSCTTVCSSRTTSR